MGKGWKNNAVKKPPSKDTNFRKIFLGSVWLVRKCEKMQKKKNGRTWKNKRDKMKETKKIKERREGERGVWPDGLGNYSSSAFLATLLHSLFEF